METNRFQKWVDASQGFHPTYAQNVFREFLLHDVQELGHAEIILLDLEEKLDIKFKKNDDVSHGQEKNLKGLSKYWVFGLYETLRQYKAICRKEGSTFEFDRFKELFKEIELVRVLLAKFQLPENKVEKRIDHFPNFYWLKNQRCFGWSMYSKEHDRDVLISRRYLADTFLKVSVSDE